MANVLDDPQTGKSDAIFNKQRTFQRIREKKQKHIFFLSLVYQKMWEQVHKFRLGQEFKTKQKQKQKSHSFQPDICMTSLPADNSWSGKT